MSGTVNNPASLLGIRSAISTAGNGTISSLKLCYRGSTFVPTASTSAISTVDTSLRQSQFSGATIASAGLEASVTPPTLSGIGSGKGAHLIGTVTVSASAGSGSYTYGNATLFSGSASSSSGFTNITCVRSGNTYTFTATSSSLSDTGSISGTWRMVVSDGTSTVTLSVLVQYN